MSSDSNGSPSITPPSENCRELIINTNLSSPQPDIISALNKGDIMKIQAASTSGPLQAITHNGDVAGNIISKEQARLLNCINEGTDFQAEILAIEDGFCQIQISAI